MHRRVVERVVGAARRAESRPPARTPCRPGAAPPRGPAAPGKAPCPRDGRRCSWPASRPRPATYCNSFTDAVLTSTPTALTQLSTTWSSAFLSVGWCTSCWYWPTPIDLGSIFTSSASGSCSRRPIDTAPRTVTSWSGSSCARHLGRRVDRSARFVDHHDLDAAQAPLAGELAHEGLRLAPRGAVADGDGLDAMLLAQPLQRRRGLVDLLVGLGRVDDVVRLQIALAVDHRDLAAGAEPGIDRQHPLAAERRLQEQRAQVVGEHLDRLGVGALLEHQPHVDLDRGLEQALVGIGDRQVELARERRLGRHDHLVARQILGRVAVDLQRHAQKALGLAAPQGQQAVRRQRLGFLAKVEVVLELCALLLLARQHGADDDAPFERLLAQGGPHLGALGHHLGHDVARARPGRLDVGHLLGRIDERRRQLLARLGEQLLRQDLSASGSSPRSRAMVARVRRFGLYGRYRSSSSVFDSVATILASSAAVSLPCFPISPSTVCLRASSSPR